MPGWPTLCIGAQNFAAASLIDAPAASASIACAAAPSVATKEKPLNSKTKYADHEPGSLVAIHGGMILDDASRIHRRDPAHQTQSRITVLSGLPSHAAKCPLCY